MISKYHFLLKEPGLLGEMPDPWFGIGIVNDEQGTYFQGRKHAPKEIKNFFLLSLWTHVLNILDVFKSLANFPVLGDEWETLQVGSS